MTHRIALFLTCLVFAGSALADEAIFSRSVQVGGDVDITRPVDGSLLVAAGRVRIEAPVRGSLHVVGGKVDLGNAAAISGDASIAGGDITVNGPIEGDLHAAGAEVAIDAPVGGDVSIAAGTLDLGPDVRIAGKLTFRGEEIRRDPAAQVAGGIEHIGHGARAYRHPHRRTLAERFSTGWFWTAGLMILAALIAGALPGASQRMALALRERPWLAALLGLVALTTIPVAAVLVMITIIGIPIGLLALAGYAILLLVGYVGFAVVAGALLLERMKPAGVARTGWRVAAAVLAMLALAILARLPFVGGLVALVALVVGVGIIVTALFRPSRPADTLAA